MKGSWGIDYRLYILPSRVDLGIVWFLPIVISSTAFGKFARLVALGFGLDFFPVRISSGIFGFLHVFYGVYVGGDWSLAVDVGLLGYEGVLCGWFSIDDAFFDVFF